MASLFRTAGLTLTLALVFTALTAGTQARPVTASDILDARPVTRTKASPVISERARRFLQDRSDTMARVWVFFTDKRTAVEGGFSTRAASVGFSEKVALRRSKVGMNHVVFADLPVADTYVQQVVDLGASHRRSSKWLNAASFSVPHDRLSSIAELPFVASIRPVAAGRRANDSGEAGDDPPTVSPPEPALTDVLDYGESYSQLSQIKVPEVHNQGYNGEGVTLAIFDTGFRKTHLALSKHSSDGRVLAEWDFIFDDDNTSNELEDTGEQWDHGTIVWSIAAGCFDGTMYGPAYKANFLLAKTEDTRSETPIEEDNWVAALEWADSLGADVVTSSLCYIDWYDYEDVDGQTAAVTIAANTAAGLGIVVCNAMGNDGPISGSICPPADAFNILAVGGVTPQNGNWDGSSRGPTYDQRFKPEVCARGVQCFAATSDKNNTYQPDIAGTSVATPLVAGTVCLLIQAHPDYTPIQIRNALLLTAWNPSILDTPNNIFGWGIVDAAAALAYGPDFNAENPVGNAPLTVQFTDISTVHATSWSWDFGDEGTSTEQNPSHTYTEPGVYDVSLSVDSYYGPMSTTQSSCAIVFGDTLRFGADSAIAGQQLVSHVYLTNSQPINEITIPFIAVDTPINLSWDSLMPGERTAYFDRLQYLFYSPATNCFSVSLIADHYGNGTPPLAPGSGEILKIYWSTDPWAISTQSNVIDTSLGTTADLEISSDLLTYVPVVVPGNLRMSTVMRGDLNNDGKRNLADISELIQFVFLHGDPPVSMATADVNADGKINLVDVSYLISFVFLDGRDPVYP